MIMKLERPVEIQERIDKIEKDLADFFSEIMEKNNLDFSEIAFIPLSRRGVGLLPDIGKTAAEENILVNVLRQFGHFEKYSLFPLLDKISKFDTIVVFDDVCLTGRHLNRYVKYLEELGSIYPPLKNKNIMKATYLINKDTMKKEKRDKKENNDGKIQAKMILDDENFQGKVSNIFELIACRGEIIDPDHMFIEVELDNKQEFFTIWGHLEEIAQKNHFKLVEDGINFLHPARKKLGLYVEGDKKASLEGLGFEFPGFIEEIEIAKFRMVFELELSEGVRDISVFTKKFEAVPILNPVIDNSRFSPESCDEYWESDLQLCKLGLISKEKCKKKGKPSIDYLAEKNNYYSPGYDCIIYNLVKPFSDYFLNEIKSFLEENIKRENIEWLHVERLIKFWQELGFI